LPVGAIIRPAGTGSTYRNIYSVGRRPDAGKQYLYRTELQSLLWYADAAEKI